MSKIKDQKINKLKELINRDNEAKEKERNSVSHTLKITIPVNGQFDSQTFFHSCSVVIKDNETLEEATNRTFQWCIRQNAKQAGEAMRLAKDGQEFEYHKNSQ